MVQAVLLPGAGELNHIPNHHQLTNWKNLPKITLNTLLIMIECYLYVECKVSVSRIFSIYNLILFIDKVVKNLKLHLLVTS